MSSVSTDRLQGVNVGAAVKVPCRVATTANITLSGLQAIDGVTVAQDDRVLVKNQTTASQNGIYLADSGAWERDKDWDGSYDVKKGTVVHVTEGATYTRTWWEVTTSDPITVGTTGVTIIQGITDSAIITFLPSGIALNNTRTRTVQDKEREQFSATDAKNNDGTAVTGDGSNVDTTGIQAALTGRDTGNGEVQFPPLSFLVDATLTIPRGVYPRGHGAEATTISAKSTFSSATPLLSLTSFPDAAVTGIRIQCAGFSRGLLATSSINMKLADFHVDEFSLYGVKLASSSNSVLDHYGLYRTALDANRLNTDVGVLLSGGSATCIGAGAIATKGVGIADDSTTASGVFLDGGANFGDNVTGWRIALGQSLHSAIGAYWEGVSQTPISIGDYGSGAVTSMNLWASQIAQSGNSDFTLTSGEVVTLIGNELGRSVTFGAGINFLVLIGNTQRAGTQTINTAKYFDLSGSGLFTGNIDINLGTRTNFGTLTVDTSKGSNPRTVCFGDIGTPASAVGLYLRSTTASNISGASPLNFFTGGNLTAQALQLASVGSSVNYPVISGAVSGANASINVSAENLLLGSGAAIATTATAGYIMFPSCAGTPTGVPTGQGAGKIPMIFDTSGVKLWFYTGGAWKGVVVA